MEMREQSLIPENENKDQILNEEGQLNEVQVENDECVTEVEAEKPAVSKDDLVAVATELAQKDASEVSNDEIASLKHSFYAIRKVELEAEKASFLAKGNEEAAFAAKTDEAEEQFKALLNTIKEKKAELRAKIEAEMQENQQRKEAIIAEINTMAADTDNVNRLFPKFKELQQDFKAIGKVPPTVETAIEKQYKEAVERFYDQNKINKELRDYDFKKNLETKQLLCAEAEKLAEENDVITAFKRLQDLHEKWRETGPVAKEIREEIWAKFKDASAAINKKYQAHFEARKAKEQENEVAKTAICEKVEAFDFDSLKSYAAWEEMTKAIIEAQEEWKKLGFASKKMNNALFARFRQTCDKFFNMKADYFKNMKDEMTSNLEKKIALCERAEALKDSTDWKKTADELVAIQKEWKTIGSVAKKHSDSVWKRFQAACDYFFEQKKKSSTGVRQIEHANLKQKREIIAELKTITSEMPHDEAVAKVKELQARWQEVGHVPFKEKDKIYEAYREATNALYDMLDIRGNKANFANFESAVAEMAGDENKLYREREKLLRTYEQKRNELLTCENNLGFFNSKSKSGDSMLKELERRIQRIKDDIATIEKKIEVIDSKI